MITAPIVNHDGVEQGNVDLAPSLFEGTVNKSVMHQAVLRQLANARQGTHDTKTRGEVRGGGRKPYAQKGTGRARQGSIRAPHYRGGGTVFGPHPRSYTIDMPKKQRHLALVGALTTVVSERKVVVLDDFVLETPSTKQVSTLLNGIAATGRTLFVLGTHNILLEKSARNIPHVNMTLASNLSVYNLLLAQTIVFTKDALTTIEELWG